MVAIFYARYKMSDRQLLAGKRPLKYSEVNNLLKGN